MVAWDHVAAMGVAFAMQKENNNNLESTASL